MKTAGYKLEFPSDGAAAGALEACGRESAGTSWQGQAGVFRNTVFVRTDTELAPDGFSEERCGDGGSLFQRLCLAAAADSSLLPFTGICYFSDTDAALDHQYTVTCTEAGLSCTVRSASPGLTKTWRLTWSRQPDGTFRKDDSFQYREKRRD
ncbi:MAG: hypothetical protein J6U01_02625 [Clostridia bacterium]|nr:hypothetical protein [Clostridia bacterium]